MLDGSGRSLPPRGVRVNADPGPAPSFRNMMLYVQVSLLMVAGVYLLWALLGGVDSQVALALHPELAGQVEAAVKAHQGSEQWVVEVLKIMSPHMHWAAVALVTSLIAFPLLGWLLGRYAEDPSWAGVLPLVDLLSGLNPAMIGQQDLIPLLTLPEQVGILMVQIVTLHVTAQWAWRGRN